jgi:hypothetical protein
MARSSVFVIGWSALLVVLAATSVLAAQYGNADEAKALLERAVAAVKEDKAKALDMFNKGEGGFKDRVMCSAPTSPTAYLQRIPT